MIHVKIYPEQLLIIALLTEIAKKTVDEYKLDRGQLPRYNLTLYSQKYTERMIANWKKRNRKKRYNYKLNYDLALSIYEALLVVDFPHHSERDLLGIIHQSLINKNWSPESLNPHQDYSVLQDYVIS
jgi:hypothetical protein